MTKRKLLAGWVGFALGLAALGGLAVKGFAQTISVPQISQIGAGDLFQDVVNGAPQVGNIYVPAPLLGNYSATLPGNNSENWLIGGDATTNLFQRATTGSSVTTTITYGGPDRWAYWSGTSTAMTVSQDTTAADLQTGYSAAFKMARTSGQTGVVQMCMMQEVESANSYALAGATAEVDFHAVTGANFSPASGNMTVVFISGTGTDEGVSKAAFNYNAGGGGSSTWAGQVNTAVTVSLGGAATTGRYTAWAPIPAGATEVAIALCYKPVGTAGTNDYVALGNIQLVRNNSMTTFAGSAGAAGVVNDARAKSFARRSQALETALQQRYYYQITESATIWPVAPCSAVDTTHTNCLIQFPVPMRATPTATFANGFASPTSTTQATLGACTTLAAATTVASTVLNTLNLLVNCTATTIPAAGVASFLYSNNGTGTIKVTAEF